MRFHGLSVAAIALAAAGPSWAGDIRPVVNVSTEKAHDLRGVNFAPDGQKIYAAGHVGTVPEQTKTASTPTARRTPPSAAPALSRSTSRPDARSRRSPSRSCRTATCSCR